MPPAAARGLLELAESRVKEPHDVSAFKICSSTPFPDLTEPSRARELQWSIYTRNGEPVKE